LTSVLKYGRGFIEVILRAMPFFEENFKNHSERVLKILFEVQASTRKMQTLCAHGKIIKDNSASSQVPIVKRLLEKLIYGGEKIARVNNVMEAYTTGVLKHRNLDGTTARKVWEKILMKFYLKVQFSL